MSRNRSALIRKEKGGDFCDIRAGGYNKTVDGSSETLICDKYTVVLQLLGYSCSS